MRSLVPTNGNGIEHAASTPLRQTPWDSHRLFDRLLGDFWGTGYPTSPSTDGAPMELVELDDAIRVSVEVPGIDPEELDVSLTGQVLTLAAEKRDGRDGEGAPPLYSERRFGTFRRSIKLPCPVDAESVEAEHRFGVVTITLAKSDAARPRRIQVKVT